MAFVRVPSALTAQRDACLASLGEAIQHDDVRLYAIVDLAAVTDAAHWHARLAAVSEARSLFETQPEASARAQAAWLLPIKAGDTWIGLRRTVDEALMARSVSWVVSTLSIGALSERLSRRLTARLSESEALFRYYDTRLLTGWWSVLTETERACFGAFGTHWWMLDADGALQGIALAGNATDDPFQSPWQVSPAQLQALTADSECHQLIGFLGKRRPDTFLDMDRGAQWRFVCAQDAEAKIRHVTRLADRLRYCELALDHGEGFADAARWQPVWRAMANGSLRLADALEQRQPPAPVSPA